MHLVIPCYRYLPLVSYQIYAFYLFLSLKEKHDCKIRDTDIHDISRHLLIILLLWLDQNGGNYNFQKIQIPKIEILPFLK